MHIAIVLGKQREICSSTDDGAADIIGRIWMNKDARHTSLSAMRAASQKHHQIHVVFIVGKFGVGLPPMQLEAVEKLACRRISISNVHPSSNGCQLCIDSNYGTGMMKPFQVTLY